MGVDGSHRSFSYILSKITLDEIISIARYRAKERHNNKRPTNFPVLDIDASWIIRKLNGSFENRIGCLLRLSLVFVRLGFHIFIICDGEERHHSKRATSKRKADCYRNNIIFHSNRMRLSLLTKEYVECQDITKKEELEKQINILKQKTDRIRNAMAKTDVNVGDDLYKSLQEEIKLLTSQEKGSRNGKIVVLQSEFQADSTIASRMNHQENDIVLCSDSDMCVLTGEDCLCIKAYKFKDKGFEGSNICDIDIFACWKSTIKKAIDSINLPSETSRLYVPPYPVFDNINDLKLRSLFAVGIGCDVYVGGVPTITVKFINDSIISYSSTPIEEHYELFISIFVSKFSLHSNKINHPILMDDNDKKKYKKFLNVLVDAIMYEPGNYIKEDLSFESILSNKYIHPNYLPIYIHPYIAAFVKRDNSVVMSANEDPTMVGCCVDYLMTCKGLGVNKEHCFFGAEICFNAEPILLIYDFSSSSIRFTTGVKFDLRLLDFFYVDLALL